MKPRTENQRRIAASVDREIKAIKAGGAGGTIRIAVPFEISPSEAEFFSRYARWRGQPAKSAPKGKRGGKPAKGD